MHNNEDKLVHVVFKFTVVWLSKTVCFCHPVLTDSSRRVTKPFSLILITRSVIGRLAFCPPYTRAKHWWTWPTGPRPLSTLTGPQLHQEPPDVSVVMRCWDLWQMNKSNLKRSRQRCYWSVWSQGHAAADDTFSSRYALTSDLHERSMSLIWMVGACALGSQPVRQDV